MKRSRGGTRCWRLMRRRRWWTQLLDLFVARYLPRLSSWMRHSTFASLGYCGQTEINKETVALDWVGCGGVIDIEIEQEIVGLE